MSRREIGDAENDSTGALPAQTSIGRRSCWAREVSPCSGRVSGEHLISHSVLDAPFYEVRGGLWPGGTPPIAASKIVSKCLCEGHNQQLSDLDTAAMEFKAALKEAERVRGLRARLPGRHRMAACRIPVSGDRLERWVLKTGFALAASLRVRLPEWTPPAPWARAVYGLEPVPTGHGMAIFAVEGDTISMDEQFHVGLMVNGGVNPPIPIGVELSLLGGWHLLVPWGSPWSECRGVKILGRTLDPRRDGIVRPLRFNFGNDPNAPVSVEFTWSGQRAL